MLVIWRKYNQSIKTSHFNLTPEKDGDGPYLNFDIPGAEVVSAEGIDTSTGNILGTEAKIVYSNGVEVTIKISQ